MRQEQWETFKRAAGGQTLSAVPLALIIDSPWIPAYLDIGHLDYYADPDVWFASNLKVMREFPEVTFFPSWWIEYGMAIEPSVLGARISFRPDQPPGVLPGLLRIEDVDSVQRPDMRADGLAALALQLYRRQRQRILDAGYTIPVVAARGPLCTAAFFRGLSEFMIDLVENPDPAHRLLEITTGLTIDWLKAQAEAIGDSVEGILVLDDIPGLLSRNRYLEFAAPYLQRVFAAFPKQWVKVYHNDANILPFLEDLPEAGFDVLNWGKNIDFEEAYSRTGGKITLMGNVSPLEVGVRGTAEEVGAASLSVLEKSAGRRLILSVGGGVSPGMPKTNIEAMIRAVREFNGCRSKPPINADRRG